MVFETESGNHVRLDLDGGEVIAWLDGKKIGWVSEDFKYGYSIRSKHVILLKNRYTHYTIVPQSKDIGRIRDLFYSAKKSLTDDSLREMEKLRASILSKGKR